jgi:hypothetical protein
MIGAPGSSRVPERKAKYTTNGKDSDMPKWIMKVAQAIKDEWTIGTYSRFCDEVDFDGATVEEIAELIWREYQAAQSPVELVDIGDGVKVHPVIPAAILPDED